MLIDALTAPPRAGATLQTDICVIGGGAAGLTLARSLSRQGLDVLLLEGGGLKETRRSQAIYRGESVGQKYFKLHRARRRHLGGSTNCWAGLCTPLRPVDFTHRPWIPHSGWPITHIDLARHYDEAREILEIGAFHPQLDVERASGEVMSGPGLKIPHFEPAYFQLSKPVRLGERWRDELRALKSARVMYNVNVTHLQLNPTGQRLDHVTCQVFDGPQFKVSARRFVLACGGIENPRLLLNARDVSPQGVGNQHDLVGRYFMEHPHIDRESLWIPSGAVPSMAYYHRRARRAQGDRIWPYLRLSAERLRREELLDFSFVFFKRRKVKREEAKHPLLREIFESTQHLYQSSGASSRVEKLRDLYTFGNPMEQSPNPESRLSLDPDGSRDELGLVRAQLDWRLTSLEKRTLRRAHELIAESLCAADYGRVRVTPTQSLDDFPPQTKGGFHHMGTTRMSDDPKRGVVDRDGRVFGVSNLYIAGSSVFTTSGASNPTFTIVALALRLAEHLSEAARNVPAEVKSP